MPAPLLSSPSARRYCILTLCSCWLRALTLFAFQDSLTATRVAPADSLRQLGGQRDTILRVKPIPFVGALEPLRDSSESIVGSEIPWVEYRYIGDLLWTRPGMYIRDMGSPGQRNQLTIGGVDWRGIALLVNGRSENDPVTGSYDMILFPTDYVERIEYITGPRAIVYGFNSTAGAINIVTKSYYTNKPYSRLRYSQGVDKYAQTDALFSQNILPRFNFMFGLTRHTYGSHRLDQQYRARFPNADHDAWSFRTKLRYNLSNSLNVVFSHLAHQTRTGLNGGIDYLRTPGDQLFNPFGTYVYNNDAYEKITNHHLDLTVAAHPAGDSTQVTSFTAYYSNQLREYRDEERPLQFDPPPNGIFLQADNRNSTAGALVRHVLQNDIHSLYSSLEAEQVEVETSPEVGGRREKRLSASARDEVRMFSPFVISAFGRVDRYRGKTLTGLGADAQIPLGRSLTFFGGVSTSDRTPTLQELYWSGDSTGTPTPRPWLLNEEHRLVEVGLRLMLSGAVQGELTLQQRNVKNPIIVDTVGVPGGITPNYALLFSKPRAREETFNQLNISLRISYGAFVAEGKATYLRQPESFHGDQPLTPLPELSLDGSFYFRGKPFDGNLELKSGLRGRFISKQTGMAPLGESGIFIPYTILRSFGPSSSGDFFLIARLGDAYVHFIWENLAGNNYMLTPFYPMYDRNVRFGVSWEFWN